MKDLVHVHPGRCAIAAEDLATKSFRQSADAAPHCADDDENATTTPLSAPSTIAIAIITIEATLHPERTGR